MIARGIQNLRLYLNLTICMKNERLKSPYMSNVPSFVMNMVVRCYSHPMKIMFNFTKNPTKDSYWYKVRYNSLWKLVLSIVTIIFTAILPWWSCGFYKNYENTQKYTRSSENLVICEIPWSSLLFFEPRLHLSLQANYKYQVLILP